MSDYSTFESALDIVDALTKRLDRLTGFDAELDNILGGCGTIGAYDDEVKKQLDLSDIYMSKSFINDCQQRFDSFKNDDPFFKDNNINKHTFTESSPHRFHSDERKPTPSKNLQNFLPTTLNGQSTFTVLEEVREVQKLKLSALEGCTLTREEISVELPLECFQRTLDESEPNRTLLPVRKNFVQSEQKTVLSSYSSDRNKDQFEQSSVVPIDSVKINMDQSDQRTVLSSESIGRQMDSSEQRTVLSNAVESNTEKWNRDEMFLFPESSPGQSTFTVLEKVQEVQKLKLSPLEGCTLTREEICLELPLECTDFGHSAMLPIIERNMTQSDQIIDSIHKSSGQSEQNTMLPIIERNMTQSDQIIDSIHKSSGQSEQNTMLSSERIAGIKNQSEQRTVMSKTVESDEQMSRGWNRDETTAFIPEETSETPGNSFNTIEEVRDIQHIKLSPLEGCSLHTQVTTTEFSPRDYLLSLASMTS